MNECEKQFRAAGWLRHPDSTYHWTHPLHGNFYLNPDAEYEMMDAWLTGYTAGKNDHAMFAQREGGGG